MMNNVVLMFSPTGEKTPYEQGENTEIKKKKNWKSHPWKLPITMEKENIPVVYSYSIYRGGPVD